ncbi:MAG: Uroporphyrinogen decarboxylase [Syntrophorhabdaceae bacterium PtaU1.Bin034]|jgi:uroporphyrinogen decarboxylase|nr:MAG: Uroporphyrinogen decarboxylase [Syntrophorhabdaceae bacterium PtaU1.Bin034]
MRDKMFPLDRLDAYSKGGNVDRLPCVPIVGNTAARVINVKVSELRNNGELLAEAQVEAYRLFGYDTIRIFTDLYVQAEAMGARVVTPPDETAYLDTPAITDASRITRLRPADPAQDGCLPEHLSATRIAVREVGSEVPVTTALTCPFTNASFLIGTENLVRLMYKDPAAVHHLCELSLQTSLIFADAVIEAGATPSLTDPMSSSTVISPARFREFSLPYLGQLIAHLHAKGKKVTLHICGKTDRIWDCMVEAGADCISIDNQIDLSQAREKVGDKVRLMGNVEPSEVMLQGTPDDVRKAVRACVRKAWQSPKGYVVASGCSLPTETPFANIHAMMDAVREIGFPATEEKLREEPR